MTIKSDSEVIQKYRELEKIGSMKVTILVDQVIEIVVAELTAKYKACKKRNDGFADSFRTVLSFYLDDEEMKEIEEIGR